MQPKYFIKVFKAVFFLSRVRGISVSLCRSLRSQCVARADVSGVMGVSRAIGLVVHSKQCIKGKTVSASYRTDP